MKRNAYTLGEQLLVVVIIGFITTIMTSTFNAGQYKKEALDRAAKAQYIRVDLATKNILARYTTNFNFFTLKDSTGTFSAASSSSVSRLLSLYKKVLIGFRSNGFDSTYSSRVFTDGVTSVAGLKPSSYSGYVLKNRTYFGIKLNNSCNTTISYIYDPTEPNKRSKSNTCGTIFYDINGKNEPNLLGVDQFIIAIGKFGVK